MEALDTMIATMGDDHRPTDFPVCVVPPVGFEPTHPAPEADALSPELRGLSAIEDYQASQVEVHLSVHRALRL
jgi:hypothetical protein